MDEQPTPADEQQAQSAGAAAPETGMDPSGITESDEDIVEMVYKCRRESDAHLHEWREEARTCYAMVAGDQWTDKEKADLEEKGRAAVVFNRIQKIVDSVSGSEINNRQEVSYLPRQVGDSGQNDVLTGAAKYVRDGCDAEDEDSDAFVDVIICGLGATETRVEYEEDPDGEIRIERVDPLHCRYDPAAKKRNLMDRRWNQREEWKSREDIEAMWPDVGAALADLPAGTDGASDEHDTEPHDATNARFYERDAKGYDAKSGKFRVICHEWYTLENICRMQDPVTGGLVELDNAKYQRLVELSKERRMQLPPHVCVPRRVYKRAFVVGKVVLQKGIGPSQVGFSLQFITGKRDRNKNVWYGLVRPMIDPQKWANKFFSQILHIINSNSKGGLLVEEDAVDNIRELESKWAEADSVIKVASGAIAQRKILPKPMPQLPTGPERMLQFAVASIPDASGVNLEQLGLADRAQPAALEHQRRQSGLVILAGLFSAMRHYRKVQGRVLADFIRQYIPEGKLIRIVGGDGTEQYIPLIKDPSVFHFDVVVDESPVSHNVKERNFMVLTQTLPMMAKLGMPPPPNEILDALPLPAALIAKWKQAMSPDSPVVQQLKGQMQQMDQQARATIGQLQEQLQGMQQQLQQNIDEARAKAAEAFAKDATQQRADAIRSRELDIRDREVSIAEQEQVAQRIQTVDLPVAQFQHQMALVNQMIDTLGQVAASMQQKPTRKVGSMVKDEATGKWVFDVAEHPEISMGDVPVTTPIY